jgi:hypothetical protein
MCCDEDQTHCGEYESVEAVHYFLDEDVAQALEFSHGKK